MELFLRLSLLAVITGAMGLIIKKDVPQIALVLSVSACAVILFFAARSLSCVIADFKEVLVSCGLEISILVPLLKLCLISCAEKITGELCHDAGERALAANVSILSKIIQIIIILPLIRSVLKSVISLCSNI